MKRAIPAAESRWRCLSVFIEPTPYLLPRIALLQQDPRLEHDLHFITENASQQWNLSASELGARAMRRKGEPLYRIVARTAGIVRDVLRGRYAVAHLAGWGHPVLAILILALRTARVPFSIESDTPLPHRFDRAKEVVKRRLYPRMFRWAGALLAGGRPQAAYFRHYGVPEERIRIAYMTVDIRAIRLTDTLPRDQWRQQFGIGPGQCAFLYVGRLEPYKGIDDLLSAAASLARRRPEFRLVIAGDGSRREAVRRSASLGHALYVGRLSSSEVVQWMRASDALVLPSLRESWGLVVNEAMACGLPVIASDRVGATEDLVWHRRNGLIYPAGDSAALVDAMSRLLLDPALRDRMGRESAEIISPWTVEREAGVIRDTLHELCGLG